MWLWVAFIVFVLIMLALDLGVFHRRDHIIEIREALAWSAFWVALALAFNVGVYYLYERQLFGVGEAIGHALDGKSAALQFLTGYVIEKSLSLDNIFVIALIFSYFRVPPEFQHRALFWGVLGALVMRGVMIGAGAALIQRFDWMVYVFGGLLLATAVKLLIARHDNLEPDKNPLVRLVRRWIPVTTQYDGHRFITREGGRRCATPLLLVLVVIESTDLLFAVDSIPAIFAVTRDPFLVFTSNVFAILGLRSLYFALAGLMHRFRFLKMSLVFVLAFVGVKMLLSHHYPIPTIVSLAVIGGILGVGVVASIVGARRDTAALPNPLPTEVLQPSALAPDALWANARRIVIVVISTGILIVGAALLVLPGPGLLVIFIGLSLLAGEFVWARRLLRRVKKQVKAATGQSPLDDGDEDDEKK